MKQGARLLADVLTHDNLMLAFCNAAKGKADRKEVIAFRQNLSMNISRLRKDLADLSMVFGRYTLWNDGKGYTPRNAPR